MLTSNRINDIFVLYKILKRTYYSRYTRKNITII